MLCNYFFPLSHGNCDCLPLTEISRQVTIYQKCMLFLSVSLLSLNDLLIHLPFPLLELIASCVSTQSPFPMTAAHLPLSHLHSAPALYWCVGLIQQFCIGAPCKKGKGERLEKGSRTLTSSSKDRQEKQSCLTDLWKDRKQCNLLP